MIILLTPSMTVFSNGYTYYNTYTVTLAFGISNYEKETQPRSCRAPIDFKLGSNKKGSMGKNTNYWSQNNKGIVIAHVRWWLARLEKLCGHAPRIIISIMNNV